MATTSGGANRPLEPVEVARVEAETAAAQALVELRQAETRKTLLEVDRAELSLEKARRDRSDELASDKHNHVYAFNGQVGASSVQECIKQLTVWDRQASEPLTVEIVFNSPGGSVVDGMALFDYIRLMQERGHYVITSTIGMAASMAGILLQAGDKRIMGREAWILVHEGSFAAGGRVGEVEDTVDWIKMVHKRILSIFASRSKLTEAQIKRRWTRTDWWIASDTALELGLVDEVR